MNAARVLGVLCVLCAAAIAAPTLTPDLTGLATLWDGETKMQNALWIENPKELQMGNGRTTVTVARRTLTSLSRQDAAVSTAWTVEPLLKDLEDLKAYLALPDEVFRTKPDVAPLFKAEAEVADRGVVMVDTGDPPGINYDNRISFDAGVGYQVTSALLLTTFYEIRTAISPGSEDAHTINFLASDKLTPRWTVYAIVDFGLTTGAEDYGLTAGASCKF